MDSKNIMKLIKTCQSFGIQTENIPTKELIIHLESELVASYTSLHKALKHNSESVVQAILLDITTLKETLKPFS
ncbi:hypothetical protein cd3_096 [Carnobacterium phage cd3]|uniref:Uncharacterized protein n=2 Tax=Carnodivirus TaxID=3044682 RepID=A0AAE7VIZ0_9CAUD|nr:hypothetical protein PQD68_gp096 [Carnobacterium phage cd2]YP_010676561.1 hypothetical protein PQD69_gp095 [Carnobacterium phage cd4]QXP45222.1 hypothetical protein cd2_096 [Carnobacterium phage cd2]QXP45223.1 hypothetical protein cd3_096 [Carnobacterium phage cd3]QXP45415.1 hypothetical protein cd4_095 [Carnobacterium phage cd4]